MLKNYLISAWRNLTRNRAYATLNLIGLSAGLLAFLYIQLYVDFESSYDQHIPDYKRIYRLESHFTIGGKSDLVAVTAIPLAPALKLEFPEVENFARFARVNDATIRVGEKELPEEEVYWSDSTVFDLFPAKVINGDTRRALADVKSAVITRSFAERYFGTTDAVGKSFLLNHDNQFKVNAVVEDLPGNTHLKYSCLLSMVTIAKRDTTRNFNDLSPAAFWNINIFSYVKLHDEKSIEAIHSKFPGFYKKYMAEIGDKLDASFVLLATRLDKIHLSGGLSADLPTGNKMYLWVFIAVALFILLLVVINYTNMSTARAATRAKEVGIRKVAGAWRGQLIAQFLGESVMAALIAWLLALIFGVSLLQWFNLLTGKEFSIGQFLGFSNLVMGLIISIVTGILAGIYPAFYLSSLEPVNVLKGLMPGTRGRLRRVLVTFQLVVAIVMIFGTLSVDKQLKFMQKYNPGFNKENILVTPVLDTNMRKRFAEIRQKMLQQPGVLDVASSSGIPGRVSGMVVMRVEQADGKMGEHAINFMMVDTSYLQFMGVKLASGRFFDGRNGTELKEAVIINEVAAKKFGWGDNAIGKKVQFGINLDGTADRYCKVVGVVKDFNYASLHNPIEPLFFFIGERPGYYVSVKVDGSVQNATHERVVQTWQSFGSRQLPDFKFLDQTLSLMYKNEQKIGQLFAVASALSIIIALLGLMGLSSFVVRRRMKEMSIRKILGASDFSIARLFLREFLVLVLVAFVIGAPLAWYLINEWLSSFAYHTSPGWGVFFAAGLMSLLVTLTTTSVHIWKAARMNPSEIIKYE